MSELDIRVPMGIMFSILGTILVVYGLSSHASVRLYDIDINVLWGAVILCFGITMLCLAMLARRKSTGETK